MGLFEFFVVLSVLIGSIYVARCPWDANVGLTQFFMCSYATLCSFIFIPIIVIFNENSTLYLEEIRKELYCVCCNKHF